MYLALDLDSGAQFAAKELELDRIKGSPAQKQKEVRCSVRAVPCSLDPLAWSFLI